MITATAGGIIKRTPRHLYNRQRRGGMGIFDLDAPDEDPPALLTIADVTQHLIVVTSLGRAFPVAVSQLAESPVHGRGESLRKWLPLTADERVALLAPDLGAGYFTLVTRQAARTALALQRLRAQPGAGHPARRHPRRGRPTGSVLERR